MSRFMLYYCNSRRLCWRFTRKFRLKLIFKISQILKLDATKAKLWGHVLEIRARHAKGWISTPCARLLPHTKKTNVERFFAPWAKVWIEVSCENVPNVTFYVLLKHLTKFFFALRAKVEVKINLQSFSECHALCFTEVFDGSFLCTSRESWS